VSNQVQPPNEFVCENRIKWINPDTNEVNIDQPQIQNKIMVVLMKLNLSETH
jgi:hypothetical protein